MKSVDTAPLTDNERAAVREAARILKERFPVEEIVLFGSKARGDFDAESDIDLLVLTSREVHWQERQAMIGSIYELELDRDVFMSLLILPRQDWKIGDYTVLPIIARSIGTEFRCERKIGARRSELVG